DTSAQVFHRGQHGTSAQQRSTAPCTQLARRRPSRRVTPQALSTASYQGSEMANFLKTSTRQEILRLVQLGWTHRRIARELKVDRGTVSRYARSATPGATADRQLWPLCYEDNDWTTTLTSSSFGLWPACCCSKHAAR